METDIKWVNFVHCTDLNAFTANKYSETNTEGKITNDNIVFIKKEKLIWTNDQFYTCDGDAIQELANNLGLLGTELSDFKTYIENTFAKDEVIRKYIDSKIFVGTSEEYESVKDEFPIGALVILMDEELPTVDAGASSGILGKGVLGQLILGKV